MLWMRTLDSSLSWYFHVTWRVRSWIESSGTYQLSMHTSVIISSVQKRSCTREWGDELTHLFRHWKKLSWKSRSRRKLPKGEVSSGKCRRGSFAISKSYDPWIMWSLLPWCARSSLKVRRLRMPSKVWYWGGCSLFPEVEFYISDM